MCKLVLQPKGRTQSGDVGPHLYLAPVDRYQTNAAYLVVLTHVLDAREM
jgi:hypothetical protein